MQLDCDPIPGQVPDLVFRDDDIWVISKPQGWLTHPDGTQTRPSLVEWLEEPVGTHQRLDVDTTGVIAFSRTPKGARILQTALENRTIKKTYVAITDKAPPKQKGTVDQPVPGRASQPAVTHYRVLRSGASGTVLELNPITGRKHQIRFHLARLGVPIRGDARYGDPIDRRAPRTLLHCHRLEVPGYAPWTAPVPPDFAFGQGLGWTAIRHGLDSDDSTSCYRLFHGDGEGQPNGFVDRYGDWLLTQYDASRIQLELPSALGIYGIDGHKDRSHGGQLPPTLLKGQPAPERLIVTEHNVQYLVGLGQQLSTGLFLDQRPQRTWLAQNAHGLRILNTFAHAGGFSIAAATCGASTVSLDLSKKWLERIPEQLAVHGISTEHHDWIYGDVFDWIPRLARRGETFDIVILDPPSTSVGRRKKRWSAPRDYPELIRIASDLVAPGGALWTATNHRKLTPHRFLNLIEKAMPPGVRLERICPPAVDFPGAGPANQKTFIWRWPT